MSSSKDFNTFRGGSSDAQNSSLLHNGMRLGSSHNEQDAGFEFVMLPVSEEPPVEPQLLTEEDYALLMDDIEIKEEKIPDVSSDEEPEEIAGEKLIPQVAASLDRDPLKSEVEENWSPQNADIPPRVLIQHNAVYKCERCLKSFTSQETLKNHFCVCNVSNVQPSVCTRYQCLKCEKLFVSLNNLKSHGCQETVQSATCNPAESPSLLPGNTLQNINVAPNNKNVRNVTYLCSTCRISFKHLDNFKKHVCKCNALKCKNCNRLFINPFYLKNHIKICQMQPNVNSVLKKSKVAFQLTSQVSVLQPQREEKKEKRYTCKICNVKLSCKSEAEKHMISAHCQSSDSDEELSCDKCHFTCAKQHQLEEHLKLHKTKFSCSKCDFICFAISDLSDHNKIHDLACSEPKFSCHICDFICDSRDELVSHDATHINCPQDSTLPCNTCDFAADSVIELQQHKKLHLAESLCQYHCQFCGVSFINEDELKSHIKEKHSADDNQLDEDISSDKNSDVEDSDRNNSDAEDSDEEYQPNSSESDEDCFTCYLCDIQFTSKSMLRQHQTKIHTCAAKTTIDDVTITAPVVSESIQKYLTGRQRLHNDIFLCSHCNIEFTSSNLLYYHAEKFHADIKMKLRNKKKLGRSGPNKCDECKSCFKSASVLRLHKLLHRGIKAFPCRYCGKQYAFNNAVLNHYKKVHPESGQKVKVKKMPVKCLYCDKVFSNDYQRHCHYLRSHTSQPSKVLPQTTYHNPTEIRTFERKSSWFDYFECNHCLKRFPSDTKLFVHGQMDHRDIYISFKSRSSGSLPCEECGAACESMKQLRQHMMRHRGIKAYHCRYCTWKATSVSGLKTHVIKRHGQEYKKFQEEKAEKMLKLSSKSVESSDGDTDESDDIADKSEESRSQNVEFSSESNLQAETHLQEHNLMENHHERENELVKEKRRKLNDTSEFYMEKELITHNCATSKEKDVNAQQVSSKSKKINQSNEEKWESDEKNASEDEWEMDTFDDASNQQTEFSEVEQEHNFESTVDVYEESKSKWFDFFECNHCFEKFSNCEKLFVHGQLNHKDIFVKFAAKTSGSLPCEECNATCDTKKQLKDHIMRHRGIKAYRCKFCSLKTASATGMKTHVKRAHGQEYINFVKGICTDNSKKVTETSSCENVAQGTGQGDARHTEFLDYERDNARSAWFDYYECNHCLERFASNTKLFIHGQLKHKDISLKFVSRTKGPLKCEECPASCEDRAQLRDHIMHHRDIKAYHCNYCSKKGYTACTIKVHVMTSHKKEYDNFKRNKAKMLELKKLGNPHNVDETSQQLSAPSNAQEKTEIADIERSNNFYQHNHAVFFCSHCRIKFKSQVMLFEHAQKVHSDVQCQLELSQHAEQGDFQCNECSATFSKITSLRSHILLHRGVKAYVCRFCGQTYACRLALEMHYQAEHPNGEFIDHTKLLVRTANEEAGNFKCDICKMGFKTIEILAHHKWRHTENFRCKYCNQGFARRSARWAHYVKCHQKEREAEKNKSTGVEQKNEKTSKEDKVDAEDIFMKYCSKNGRRGDSVFSCNHCSIGFKGSNQLFYHAQKIHSDISVKLGGRLCTGGTKKCDECPSTFKTVSNLRLHKLLHRGISPYPCKFCGVAFNCRSSVLAHIKVEHPEGKNVIQNYSCNATKVLRRKHYEEYGDLICDVCKVGYKNEEILRRHKLRHTKPFTCKICGKGFESRSAQWYHQKKMHHDEATEASAVDQESKEPGSPVVCKSKWVHSYECNHCRLEFTTLTKLFVHVQDLHQDKSKRAKRENNGDHKCEECRSSFKSLFRVREHILEHRGVMAYKCRYCQYRTCTLLALQLHLKKQHTQKYIKLKKDITQIKQKKLDSIKLKNTSHHCKLCDLSYGSSSVLKLHVATKHGNTPHRRKYAWCSKCCKCCSSVTALKLHLKVAHSKSQVVCSVCDMKFATQASLAYHMWKLHDIKLKLASKLTHTQNHNKLNLSKPQNLKVHKKHLNTRDLHESLRRSTRLQEVTKKENATKKKISQAGTCTSNAGKSFKLHIKQKNKAPKIPEIEKPLILRKCKLCEVQCAGKIKLYNHMKSTHQTSVFACDLCSELYLTKKSMQRHIKWHFPPSYKCSHCNKCYNKKYHLETHICVNAEGKTFACQTCSRMFNSKELLALHCRTKHVSVDTQCKCDDCGKILKNKISLKTHINRLHLSRPYLCSKCGATFSLLADMRLHTKRHEEEKWQCPHCPRRFLTKRDFYQHRNMTHLKRCYVCNICGRAIKAKQHYDFHMARHKYQVKPFPCSLCDKKYATLTARKYHLRVAHKIHK